LVQPIQYDDDEEVEGLMLSGMAGRSTAVGLAAASVLTALLADSTSVSTALGLAAVVSALLAQRA
jgi:hypothetical protein